MNHFVITKDPENNPFDRQERIEWWSQEALKKARVLVIGAGAIGNETLKNLALLGVGNILVCDMDTISVSNLSRTVLFRREDAGKKKAQTAALRTKEMSLEPECAVDFFDGDIVWELGTGVFRYFDVVLGCLDNVETRFAINRNCRYVSKPWIDAGISELAGNIKVFGAEDECVCYQCFASEEEYKQLRKRYSCDDFKKRMFSEHKMPTVQISSAIVSALQVQEAVKIILGKQALTGKKIFFQGTIGEFELIKLRRDPECLAHASYADIIGTPFTNKSTVRELLDYVSKKKGGSPVLMLDRMFLESAECPKCGKTSDFLSPAYSMYIDEVKCAHCGTSSDRDKLNYVRELSYDSGRLLDMTLEQIGVPKLHIIAIRVNGDVKYYELSADIPNVMPNIYAKESRR